MSGEPDSGAVDEAAVAVYFLQLREMIDACDETAEMRRTVQGSDVSGSEKSTQPVYLNRALCSDFIDGDRYEGANFGWNEPNEDDGGRREDDERANGSEQYTDGLVNQLNVTNTANSQTATMSSPTSQQVADTTRSIVHYAQNDPRRQIVRNAPPPPSSSKVHTAPVTPPKQIAHNAPVTPKRVSRSDIFATPTRPVTSQASTSDKQYDVSDAAAMGKLSNKRPKRAVKLAPRKALKVDMRPHIDPLHDVMTQQATTLHDNVVIGPYESQLLQRRDLGTTGSLNSRQRLQICKQRECRDEYSRYLEASLTPYNFVIDGVTRYSHFVIWARKLEGLYGESFVSLHKGRTTFMPPLEYGGKTYSAIDRIRTVRGDSHGCGPRTMALWLVDQKQEELGCHNHSCNDCEPCKDMQPAAATKYRTLLRNSIAEVKLNRKGIKKYIITASNALPQVGGENQHELNIKRVNNILETYLKREPQFAGFTLSEIKPQSTEDVDRILDVLQSKSRHTASDDDADAANSEDDNESASERGGSMASAAQMSSDTNTNISRAAAQRHQRRRDQRTKRGATSTAVRPEDDLDTTSETTVMSPIIVPDQSSSTSHKSIKRKVQDSSPTESSQSKIPKLHTVDHIAAAESAQSEQIISPNTVKNTVKQLQSATKTSVKRKLNVNDVYSSGIDTATPTSPIKAITQGDDRAETPLSQPQCAAHVHHDDLDKLIVTLRMTQAEVTALRSTEQSKLRLATIHKIRQYKRKRGRANKGTTLRIRNSALPEGTPEHMTAIRMIHKKMDTDDLDDDVVIIDYEPGNITEAQGSSVATTSTENIVNTAAPASSTQPTITVSHSAITQPTQTVQSTTDATEITQAVETVADATPSVIQHSEQVEATPPTTTPHRTRLRSGAIKRTKLCEYTGNSDSSEGERLDEEIQAVAQEIEFPEPPSAVSSESDIDSAEETRIAAQLEEQADELKAQMAKFDKVMKKKKQKRSRSARSARLEALMDTQEAYEQHRAAKSARKNESRSVTTTQDLDHSYSQSPEKQPTVSPAQAKAAQAELSNITQQPMDELPVNVMMVTCSSDAEQFDVPGAQDQQFEEEIITVAGVTVQHYSNVIDEAAPDDNGTVSASDIIDIDKLLSDEQMANTVDLTDADDRADAVEPVAAADQANTADRAGTGDPQVNELGDNGSNNTMTFNAAASTFRELSAPVEHDTTIEVFCAAHKDYLTDEQVLRLPDLADTQSAEQRLRQTLNLQDGDKASPVIDDESLKLIQQTGEAEVVVERANGKMEFAKILLLNPQPSAANIDHQQQVAIPNAAQPAVTVKDDVNSNALNVPDSDDEQPVDATTEQKLLADTSDVDTDADMFDADEVLCRKSTCRSANDKLARMSTSGKYHPAIAPKIKRRAN